MFIQITKSACGLVVGKSYNLCDQAANDLIAKGQATKITVKAEIKKAEKEEAERKADKKAAKLAGNLAIVAEKATKAAKDAVDAVEAAKKAQAEAEAALKKVQAEAAAEPEPPTTEDHKETCVDFNCKGCGTDDDEIEYTGDFSEFDPAEIRGFADAAELPDNVTNPATIIKKLIEAGFDPKKITGPGDGDE